MSAQYETPRAALMQASRSPHAPISLYLLEKRQERTLFRIQVFSNHSEL